MNCETYETNIEEPIIAVNHMPTKVAAHFLGAILVISDVIIGPKQTSDIPRKRPVINSVDRFM